MTAFDNIKKISKSKGLSLQEVAKKAGLSRNLIYQYNGKTEPTMETLRKIAKVLDVKPEKLLTSNSKPTSQKLDVMTIDKALDPITSFNGKPVTEHDKKVMKDLLVSYLKNKE